MEALVVYESLFGNTAAIAGRIAETLGEQGIAARALPVTHVEPAETGASTCWWSVDRRTPTG